MKWHTIYFAQGDEAQPLLHQLTRTEGGAMYGATDGSIQDVATQLAQHDTGLLPEATDGEPWGSRDDTAQVWVNGTHYTLAWNVGMGYISLQRPAWGPSATTQEGMDL